jgi:hypothetical protein
MLYPFRKSRIEVSPCAKRAGCIGGTVINVQLLLLSSANVTTDGAVIAAVSLPALVFSIDDFDGDIGVLREEAETKNTNRIPRIPLKLIFLLLISYAMRHRALLEEAHIVVRIRQAAVIRIRAVELGIPTRVVRDFTRGVDPVAGALRADANSSAAGDRDTGTDAGDGAEGWAAVWARAVGALSGCAGARAVGEGSGSGRVGLGALVVAVSAHIITVAAHVVAISAHVVT